MRVVPPHPDVLERIQALWDRLADFDAAATDLALRHLLAETADIVSAQNAYWLGVVRLSADEKDQLRGWRPQAIRYLHRSSSDTRYARRSIRSISRGAAADLDAAAQTREAGSFRAHRLCDLDLTTRELAECRAAYAERGIVDVLWVAIPMSDDAECYYGFHRKQPDRRFTVTQRETAAYAMRGLKWFHRQVMLSRGTLVARAPLLPAERRVMALLLTPGSEKEIAGALGLTAATTHKYVTDVFRKFGVSGRSGLTALWLGSSPPSRRSRPDPKR